MGTDLMFPVSTIYHSALQDQNPLSFAKNVKKIVRKHHLIVLEWPVNSSNLLWFKC